MGELTITRNIPYSDFDWQSTFITMVENWAVEAAVEVVQEHQQEEDVEWKDEEGVMNVAYQNDFMAKVFAKMQAKFDTPQE